MKVVSINLKNWRNFKKAEITLSDRAFFVGPNASGKSNFLEVFRFLRDLVKAGGGLQKAVVIDRGGLSKIRCLAARRDPLVEISITMEDLDKSKWKYEIGLKQQGFGLRLCLLKYERVYHDDKCVLDRPDDDDGKDEMRLSQTHLEQINSNQKFRCLAEYFNKIQYLHIVPQLLKYPSLVKIDAATEDPFGVHFVQRIWDTGSRTRASRLKKIEAALRLAVPEFEDLDIEKDEKGIPHLVVKYRHWRHDAVKQQEDQLSDGTLRLIGLLWALLDSDSLLLLEEPELSLHSAIVRQLAPLIWRMQRIKGRQVFISTHSADLLGDKGIAPNEVLYLQPLGMEGTTIKNVASSEEIGCLLDGGMSMADAVLPKTVPENIDQMIMAFE